MDKRDHVIDEIITTERNYSNKLQTVLDLIIIPLKSQNILDEEDIRGQFGFWETLVNVHQTLYKRMCDDREKENLNIGLLFTNFGHFLKIYSSYLTNFEVARARRGYLLTHNKKFVDLLEKIRSDDRCNGMNIESFLIEPVQRIPRYRLLLEALLKCTPEDHSERADIQVALESVSVVAYNNNEAMRSNANSDKMMEVMMSFDIRSRINLFDDPSRSFIKEANLMKQCRRGVKEFRYWLFNDMLLYGESNGLGSYKLNRQIMLINTRLTENIPPNSIINYERSFLIESKAKTFITITKDEAEKKEWCEAIKEALGNVSKNKKHNNDAIAPLWTPDQAQESCEQCGAIFNLFIRRHHCRKCGKLVCGNCSTYRIKLSNIDINNLQRACSQCYKDSLNVDVVVNDGESGLSVNPIAKSLKSVVDGLRNHSSPGARASVIEDDRDTSSNVRPSSVMKRKSFFDNILNPFQNRATPNTSAKASMDGDNNTSNNRLSGDFSNLRATLSRNNSQNSQGASSTPTQENSRELPPVSPLVTETPTKQAIAFESPNDNDSSPSTGSLSPEIFDPLQSSAQRNRLSERNRKTPPVLSTIPDEDDDELSSDDSDDEDDYFENRECITEMDRAGLPDKVYFQPPNDEPKLTKKRTSARLSFTSAPPPVPVTEDLAVPSQEDIAQTLQRPRSDNRRASEVNMEDVLTKFEATVNLIGAIIDNKESQPTIIIQEIKSETPSENVQPPPHRASSRQPPPLPKRNSINSSAPLPPPPPPAEPRPVSPNFKSFSTNGSMKPPPPPPRQTTPPKTSGSPPPPPPPKSVSPTRSANSPPPPPPPGPRPEASPRTKNTSPSLKPSPTIIPHPPPPRDETSPMKLRPPPPTRPTIDEVESKPPKPLKPRRSITTTSIEPTDS